MLPCPHPSRCQPACVCRASPQQACVCRATLQEVPAEAVDKMIEAEPRILDTDIQFLLSEIERLLPGQDPKRLLLQNPSVRASA
jgi:hypothetical protein